MRKIEADELRPPREMAERLAEALRVRTLAGGDRCQVMALPTSVEDRQALLMEYLRRQRCLPILDNFVTVLQIVACRRR